MYLPLMYLFSERTDEEELMDDLSLDKATMDAVLHDITKANHWLGGNAITIRAINQYINTVPQDTYRIVDVGCGDGDMLRAVAKSLRKRKVKAHLIGVDINEKSITVARDKSMDYPEISYETRDILKTDPTEFRCDILLCTLTMHHFPDSEILNFIRSFIKVTDGEIIINDLQRNRLAYLLFLPFSWIFMKTHIAKHDGLISIKRSFSKKDLYEYTQKLEIKNSIIEWKWAFRYLWRIRTV